MASIETLRDGVVSRGVLLDVARGRGGAGLPGGEGVMPEELEAAERADERVAEDLVVERARADFRAGRFDVNGVVANGQELAEL